MVKFSEIDVMNAVTAPVPKGGPHATVALVEHLRTCAPISSYLCNALADLLDENGTSALQLRLARRDTRRMSSKEDIDRDYIAYQRMLELTGLKVMDALCQGIVALLPGWELRYQQRQYCFRHNGIIEIRLRPRQPISKRMAIRIAALQINKPFETVKKMIAAVEAANREA